MPKFRHGKWAARSSRLPLLICLVSATPLIWQWKHFRVLYWFHDDWELLAGLNNSPLTKWIWEPLAESYVPLFKLLWAAAIHAVNGSYTGMIVLLWATHFGVVFLLARILLRCGFSKGAAALSALTVGLAWSNIETLGWSTQWAPLLSTLFLLLSWDQLISAIDAERATPWRWAAALALAVASAACFVRGVLTGAVLAAFFMLVIGKRFSKRRFKVAALLLFVPIFSISVYGKFAVSRGMFQENGIEKVLGIVRFALGYELINPLSHLLPIPRKTPDARATIISGTLKLLVILTAVRATRSRERSALLTLLLLDLGTGLLLSVGRFQLGLSGATSYRYQHVSLLCFAPFLGIVAARVAAVLCFRNALSKAAFALFFIGWALLIGYPWARHSERWARWRGLEPREELARARDDERFGLASITAGRARELIRIYHLR